MKELNTPDIVARQKERKARAAKILTGEPDGRCYFAIVGAEFERDDLTLTPDAFIRAVKDPPNIFEITNAIENLAAYSAVDRYAPLITHELVVIGHSEDPNVAASLAWALVASLRIRTATEFLVPMMASHSWSTMAALTERCCSVSFLEDVPKARRIGAQKVITESDCEWVSQNFRSFISLYEAAAFRLAADCFSTYPLNANLRMSTAELWAGVEALFSMNSELRFRISALAASFLESPGERRLECYRHMKSLYDFRSKVVHGASVTNDQLISHVIEVRHILSRLLMQILEDGRLPGMDDLEEALFCVT